MLKYLIFMLYYIILTNQSVKKIHVDPPSKTSQTRERELSLISCSLCLGARADSMPGSLGEAAETLLQKPSVRINGCGASFRLGSRSSTCGTEATSRVERAAPAFSGTRTVRSLGHRGLASGLGAVKALSEVLRQAT